MKIPMEDDGPGFEDGPWAEGWEERSTGNPVIIDGRNNITNPDEDTVLEFDDDDLTLEEI